MKRQNTHRNKRGTEETKIGKRASSTFLLRKIRGRRRPARSESRQSAMKKKHQKRRAKEICQGGGRFKDTPILYWGRKGKEKRLAII